MKQRVMLLAALLLSVLVVGCREQPSRKKQPGDEIRNLLRKPKPTIYTEAWILAQKWDKLSQETREVNFRVVARKKYRYYIHQIAYLLARENDVPKDTLVKYLTIMNNLSPDWVRVVNKITKLKREEREEIYIKLGRKIWKLALSYEKVPLELQRGFFTVWRADLKYAYSKWIEEGRPLDKVPEVLKMAGERWWFGKNVIAWCLYLYKRAKSRPFDMGSWEKALEGATMILSTENCCPIGNSFFYKEWRERYKEIEKRIEFLRRLKNNE